MNLQKTLLAVALAGASLGAQAVETTMTVTGGSFAMGFFTPNGPISFAALGSGAADITDTYNAPGWDTGAAQTGAASGTIGAFAFGSAWVNTYTAASATQAGVAGGGPAPVFNGPLTNGAFTIDMSSFFANWNTTDFSQGNSSVSGTLSNCGAAGCDFTMGWDSLIVGGPFNGNTGTWVLNGTIAGAAVVPPPVPEASTYGMMLAGLGLVGFAVRRRKSMA
jgi:hypothetical protein